MTTAGLLSVIIPVLLATVSMTLGATWVVANTLGTRIDTLEHGLGARIDTLERQLGARLDSLDRRMDHLEAKIDGLTEALAKHITEHH